ncbi:uncharacterized protein LOC135224081 [Macrobrachium nipponense]|uniref:uncharacterized protein LOC135224081 n=1 Tax=Macrobrachium nipponense TaxID=159736 RepID=UPI0030C86892
MKVAISRYLLYFIYSLVVVDSYDQHGDGYSTTSNKEPKAPRLLRKRPFKANRGGTNDRSIFAQNIQPSTHDELLVHVNDQPPATEESSTGTNNQVPSAGESLTKASHQLPFDGRLFGTSNQDPLAAEHSIGKYIQIPMSNELLAERWNQLSTTNNALRGAHYQTPGAVENSEGILKGKQSVLPKSDKLSEPGYQVSFNPDLAISNHPSLSQLPARAQNTYSPLKMTSGDQVPVTKVSGPLSGKTSLPTKLRGPSASPNFPLVKPVKPSIPRVQTTSEVNIYNKTNRPTEIYLKNDYNVMPSTSLHETKPDHSDHKMKDRFPVFGNAPNGLLPNTKPQLLQQKNVLNMGHHDVSHPSINRHSLMTDHKHIISLLQGLRSPTINNYAESYSFGSQALTTDNSNIQNQQDINRIGYPNDLRNSSPEGTQQINYRPSQVDSAGNQEPYKANIPNANEAFTPVGSSNDSTNFEIYQNNRLSPGSVLQLLPSPLGQHDYTADESGEESTLHKDGHANPALPEVLGLANGRNPQEEPGKPVRGTAFGEDHGNIYTHLSNEEGSNKNVIMEVFEQVFSADEMDTNPLVKQMHNRLESQLNTLGANALSNPSFGFLVYFLLPFAVIAVLTFTLMGVAPQYLGLMGLLIPGVIMATLVNDHGGRKTSRGRSDSYHGLLGSNGNAILNDIHRDLLAHLESYGEKFSGDMSS